MFVLIAVLVGVILGQHVKISVSEEFQAFFKAFWAQAESKGLPVAQSAAAQIKEATAKSVKRVIQPKQSALDEAEQRFIDA